LPGYSLVIWRGRHVPDLADLAPEELAGYWSDVATVGRALHAVYEPAHLNYLIFGNNVPHLHTYVLPRYLDDSSPGMPLDPFVEHPVDPADFEAQLARLRGASDVAGSFSANEPAL
jgi:diadenosine tetraphosphate (Ap4A) HIT family hydrolase